MDDHTRLMFDFYIEKLPDLEYLRKSFFIGVATCFYYWGICPCGTSFGHGEAPSTELVYKQGDHFKIEFNRVNKTLRVFGKVVDGATLPIYSKLTPNLVEENFEKTGVQLVLYWPDKAGGESSIILRSVVPMN